MYRALAPSFPLVLVPLVLVAGVLVAGAGLAETAGRGDAAFGEEVFASLCVPCHHEDAKGDDRAPDIRGATFSAIKRGTSGMDSMQDFHFDAQDVADMHAYLATLVD